MVDGASGLQDAHLALNPELIPSITAQTKVPYVRTIVVAIEFSAQLDQLYRLNVPLRRGIRSGIQVSQRHPYHARRKLTRQGDSYPSSDCGSASANKIHREAHVGYRRTWSARWDYGGRDDERTVEAERLVNVNIVIP